MTRELTPGYQYGVLRVQPQAETPAYYHRNGDTLKPTIAGYYGFRYGHSKQGWIIAVVEHMNEMREYNGTTGDEEYTELPDGHYWGPIVGPWTES